MKKLLFALMIALPILAAATPLGCTDTDGNDPYTAGSCSPAFGGTYYDECTTTKYGEVGVKEYTCQGTVCQPYTVACEEGYCYEGACQLLPKESEGPIPIYEEPEPSPSPVPSTVIQTPIVPKEDYGEETEEVNLNDIGLVLGAVIILVAVAWFTTRNKPSRKRKASVKKKTKKGKAKKVRGKKKK